jgi:hypothetical protein
MNHFLMNRQILLLIFRYLEKRLKQLNPYMNEIVSHKADLSSLEVIGYGASRRKSQQKNNVEIHFCGKTNEKDKQYEEEITDNIQIDDYDKENENTGDSLNDIPDIVDLPLMGKFEKKNKS